MADQDYLFTIMTRTVIHVHVEFRHITKNLKELQTS